MGENEALGRRCGRRAALWLGQQMRDCARETPAADDVTRQAAAENQRMTADGSGRLVLCAYQLQGPMILQSR